MPDESWETYIARRIEMITRRQLMPRAEPAAEENNYGKAGCFNCDAQWIGPTSGMDAHNHCVETKHQIWTMRLLCPSE